ncbi:unnamed protein product [Adineta steineri]|uniref:Uncharacterized protein n=1 Tax=Adineta steineri TaxID=433720 RepID=A0A819GSC3_9BILA|nr:unnamed protein product [Adineta steineri]
MELRSIDPIAHATVSKQCCFLSSLGEYPQLTRFKLPPLNKPAVDSFEEEYQQQSGFKLPSHNQVAAASSVPEGSNNENRHGGSSVRQPSKRLSCKQLICIAVAVIIVLLIIIIVAAVVVSRSSKNETDMFTQGSKNYIFKRIRYAYTLPNRKKQVFLAQVLTGDVLDCKCDTSLRRPPKKNDKISNLRCNSVSGDTGGSKVYIVYENHVVYPTYLITFIP